MWFFVTITLGLANPLSLEQVCQTKWGLDHRHVTADMVNQVKIRDGVKNVHGKIIDHIIPRELGGADAVDNLQIQCCYRNKTIIGAAHKKDIQENRMHRAVCNGTISLTAAQASFVIVR